MRSSGNHIEHPSKGFVFTAGSSKHCSSPLCFSLCSVSSEGMLWGRTSLSNSHPLWTVQPPQPSAREGGQNERYEKGTSQQYNHTVLCSHSQRLGCSSKLIQMSAALPTTTTMLSDELCRSADKQPTQQRSPTGPAAAQKGNGANMASQHGFYPLVLYKNIICWG